MGKRSRIEWHGNGALIWTWGLTLIVSGVGLLLLCVAAVLWALRTPAEVAGGGGRLPTCTWRSPLADLPAPLW